MGTTRIRRVIPAPRAEVYAALIDPAAILKWRFPTGMSIRIHAFESREGGTFRVSLTYDTAEGVGKSSSHTDTYHGRFVHLVPGKLVQEEIEFETADPSMQGIMSITTILADAEGGTLLTAFHEGLPPGLSEADNEAGWSDSLGKLAAYLDERKGGRCTD